MTREEREKCLRTIWAAAEDTKGEAQIRHETEQNLNKTRDVLINNSLGAYNGTRKISNPAGSPIKTGFEIGSPAVRTDIPSAVTAAGANDPLYRAAVRKTDELIKNAEMENAAARMGVDVSGIANDEYRKKVQEYLYRNRKSPSPDGIRRGGSELLSLRDRLKMNPSDLAAEKITDVGRSPLANSKAAAIAYNFDAGITETLQSTLKSGRFLKERLDKITGAGYEAAGNVYDKLTDKLGIADTGGIKAFGDFLETGAKNSDLNVKDPLDSFLDLNINHSENVINSALLNEYEIGLNPTLGKTTRAVAAALPQLIAAYASSGLTAATSGTAALSATKNAVLNSMKNIVKNPSFWTSFFTMVGSDYEEAIKSGMNDNQATAFAILNSGLNSAVEVGSGIEELVKNTDRNLWDYTKSVFGEGFEEVEQGGISSINKAAFKGKFPEWFSLENEDAVINPKRMGEELAGGMVVGAILGTPAAISSAYSNALKIRDEKQKMNPSEYMAENLPSSTYDGKKTEKIKFVLKEDLKTEVNNEDTENFVNKITKAIPNIEKNGKVFDVKTDTIKKVGTATETITNYFESIGGFAENPILGKVELNKKGAKSTAFHGVSADKLTAIAAVKDVIEKGEIISHEENWKGRGYDTYIIAGTGLFDGIDSAVGVIVKNYPNRRIDNKFYLHEIIKLGASHTAVKNNTIRENGLTPNAKSIAQNNEAVNKIFSDDVSEEVRRFGETLGESGRKFFYSRYENEADFDTYKEAFSRFYRSGETGLDFDKMYKTTSGELKAVMPETYARIVYELGEKDIKTETKALKNKRAGAVVFERKAGGFVESPESIFVDGRFKESAGAVSKQLGMRTKIVPEGSIAGGAAAGSYADGRIKLEEDGEVKTFGHEVGHRIKELAPEEYSSITQYVFEDYEKQGQSADKIIDDYRRILKNNELKLSDNEITEEIVNDYIGRILDTPDKLQELIDNAKNGTLDTNKTFEENLTILQTFIKAIKEFVGKIKNALKRGKISKSEADKNISSAEKVMELIQNAYNAAAEYADEHRGQNVSQSRKGEKYSIKTLPDGKKYVQADKQVIHSTTKAVQEREIMSYVKNKVMKGQDVHIPLDNGEVIKITGRTAWKLADKGKYSEALYLVKGNAAGAIDEIVETSKYRKHKESFKEHSKGFADKGFDYRVAYFKDLDGKYYRLELSVGVSENGKEAYNIGEIKEMTFPDKSVTGSKAKKEKSSPNNNVSQNDNIVNSNSMKNFEKYSLKETKDYAKENAKLNKKVEALEKKLKEAKSLITPDMKALKELADSIKDEYSSEIESEELYNLMSGLKEKIKNAAEGKLSFNELLRYTSGLAREIIEQSVQLSSDRRLEYKELINQIKTTRFLIDDSVKAEFGDDWKDFRQKNQLRIGFTFDKSKATQGIDEFYRELEWNYPEFFDGLTQRSGKERLAQIEDVLESLKPVYENKFEGYMDEASEWLGTSILDSLYSKTYFDIKKLRGGKLDVEYDLEAVQEEANSVVHKIMQRQADWEERQAKQIEKKYSEKTERVIERLRESKEKFIASEGEKFRERLENREARKKKSERMRQIKFHFDRMVKKIEKPNNKNFIPEEIRKPVAQFLKSFDVRTDRMGSSSTDWLTMIYNQLKNIADGTHENADVRYSLFIDDETLGNLEDVQGLLAAFKTGSSDEQLKVSELDLKTLDLIYRTFLGIERSLSNYGRMISEGRGQLISTAAEKAISENRTDKAYSYIKGLEGGKNLFNLQMLNPLDFFHELGETFEGFYRDVRKGMDRKTLNLAKAKDYMEMCLDGLSIKELSGEKAKKMSFEITLEGDLSYLPAERNKKKTVTLELTPAQAMSFYLLTKQEQAINHISEGGIVAPDRVETLVEVGKKYVEKGKKIDEEVYESAVGRAIKISLGEIEKIRSQIKKERPELIETADLIGRFFTRECAGWGNEVSMSLYGYKKFVTRNYFPIVAGKNYVGEVYGKTNDKTLINTGITKDRTKGASNPLIIEDIFDVYARHVDKMSSYNAFVIPLQNLQSILNYSNRETGMSLRSVLEAKYGKKANEYLSRFITDLNGGSKFNADGIEFINKAISHYKQAAMGLNVRVIIQQPLSIIRAGTEIDGKYLWGAMPEKTDIDIIYRYAPIALWKSWGFFSTDTSKSLLKIMTGQKEMSDYTMAGAAKADEWTWRRIWAACELEMKDRHPEVRSGTSEYYHMVGERFSEIIDKTQTVDSVLHRSHIQRSPNEFAKMGVSFMSEPIKTYNLVRTAFIDAKSDGTKEARQKRNRTIAVCAVQMLCTGIVTGLYDTGRGEDEDENGFFKQWTLNAGENFVGDLIGLVPFIKDMFSIIQGFEPKRMEMQTIANFVNAVGNFLNEKYTIHGKIDSLAVAAAEFFGIPAGKLKREIVSVFGKNIMRAGDFNFGEYTLLKLVYDIKSEKAKGEFLDVLYRAYKDGDEKDYDKIVSDMVKNGIPYSDIEKGLLSRARKSAEKGKRYNSFSTTFQAKINITEEEDETEKTEFTVDSLSPAELKEYSMVFKEKYNKISDLLSKYTFESNMLKNKALEKAEKYSKEIALREASGGEYVIGQKTDDGEVTDSENWVEAAEKAPGTLKISEAEFIYLTVKYKNSSTTLKSETMVKAVKEKIKPEEYLKFYEVIKKADKELKKVRDEAKEEGRNVRQSKQLKIRKYRNYLKDVDLPEERAEEILSFYIRNM